MIGLFGGDDGDDDDEDGDDDDVDASEVVLAMMWLRIQSPTDDKVTLRVTCSFGTLVIAIIPIGKNIVYV